MFVENWSAGEAWPDVGRELDRFVEAVASIDDALGPLWYENPTWGSNRTTTALSNYEYRVALLEPALRRQSRSPGFRDRLEREKRELAASVDADYTCVMNAAIERCYLGGECRVDGNVGSGQHKSAGIDNHAAGAVYDRGPPIVMACSAIGAINNAYLHVCRANAVG